VSNDSTPDQVVVAWSAFLRAHAATVRLIDRDVHQQTGLPLRWYDVLLELNAAAGRRLRMQELSDAVVLSRTRVSRVVDELVAADLVRRQRNPDDGRSSYAVITEAGRRALRRAAPVYLGSIQAHFGARLSTESLAAIRDAMETLASPAETAEEET
jgi:DNA-binding MarR family transcriptional regulator